MVVNAIFSKFHANFRADLTSSLLKSWNYIRELSGNLHYLNIENPETDLPSVRLRVTVDGPLAKQFDV